MSCNADERNLKESRVRENLTHGLTRGCWGDNLQTSNLLYERTENFLEASRLKAYRCNYRFSIVAMARVGGRLPRMFCILAMMD